MLLILSFKNFILFIGSEGIYPSYDFRIHKGCDNDQRPKNLIKQSAKKYQKDPEYARKQTNERRERAKNPEWRQKMTEINREITQRPEYKEKMSNSITQKWKDPEYQRKQEESHKKALKEEKRLLKRLIARGLTPSDIQNLTDKAFADIEVENWQPTPSSSFELPGMSGTHLKC